MEKKSTLATGMILEKGEINSDPLNISILVISEIKYASLGGVTQ